MLPFASKAMTLARASALLVMRCPHNRYNNRSTVTWITSTTGPSSVTKSAKLKPTADPIMILGGSPIRVAVPPILEAKISAYRNG